jgi:hypothetical protein
MQHHKDTLNDMRVTAEKRVHVDLQGVCFHRLVFIAALTASLQHLDEFSKALAPEMRKLLSEVGKLREERR